MKALELPKLSEKFEGVLGELESKKGFLERFPESIIHKINQTNSSFHMKYQTLGNV